MGSLHRFGIATLLLTGCGRGREAAIEGHGTVEVPEIHLAPAVSARVITMRVAEGAYVQAGDTIAVLTQADLPASIEAQRARVRTAAANLEELEAGARPEEIRQAEAALSSATAEAERTRKDAERLRTLAEQQVISRQQLDAAVAAERVAREQQRSAENALALLKAGPRQERIQSARAELAQARANLEMAEARGRDLVLTAPVAGQIFHRYAEPGEVLGPNVAAVTLGDPRRPFVRIYVPARRIPELRVGQAVEVTPDGAPSERIRGTISVLGTEAEFTPRVALTETERADLMFAVRVELDPSAARALQPGLWVTARFVGGAP